MPYDPNQHHRRSIRLQGYDYQKAGAYYITLCLHRGFANHEGMTTAENILLLGTIAEGQMQLNEYGLVIQERWLFLADYYENLELDEFVIMPNHLHGIVVLGDNGKGSLSKIIQEFKTFSAKRVNQLRDMRGAPVWQRNYYEHVVRNEQDLARIRDYIIHNPAKWSEDEYHIA